MIERIKSALRSLFNWLNVWGAVLLAYALQNQTVVSELLPFLPPPLKPWAPTIALAWWALVQFAKARALKKAQPVA
jgi:hypothetical protein